MRASSFAAAATLRGGEPCTLIETRGVCPCFATAPATAAVEIPERSTPGFRAVSAETLRIVDSARTIWRTVLGFVARLWICALPLGESGWPRKTTAWARQVALPPSETR